jgi:hypothetical protein
VNLSKFLTPSANALYAILVLAQRNGVIDARATARLQKMILALFVFESLSTTHADWLEMSASGVEKIRWVFDIVLEEGSSRVVSESDLDDCLGVTLVERALSASRAKMPSPFLPTRALSVAF